MKLLTWSLAVKQGVTVAATLLFAGGVVPSLALPTCPTAKLARGPATQVTPAKQHAYIVQLKEPVAAGAYAALRRAGARITRRYRCLPIVAVTVADAAQPRLAAVAAVAHISPDLPVHRTLEYANLAVGAGGGAWTGMTPTGFTGYTGKGVTVAVIDSGINYTPDFGLYTGKSTRLVGGYDWVQGLTYNNDTAGHGTHVASCIGGNGFDSNLGNKSSSCYRHFIGVAPEANLVNLRILDANGQGSVSNAIAALDWCIQNKAPYNIRVANLSLGHLPGESYHVDPLCQAAERAWKAGIVVVCAAGNNGRKVATDPAGGVAYGTINSPGNDPYVITVGATNTFKTASLNDDWVTTYSSRGPSRLDFVLKPDLVAPGNRVIAMSQLKGNLQTVVGPQNKVLYSYYWTNTTSTSSDGYYMFSGTSMAAGLVSGAAAILLQKDPTLTPDDVKARLMRSSPDFPVKVDACSIA